MRTQKNNLTISNGSVIKIHYCKKLQEMKLLNLAGQTGIVTQCLFSNVRNPGVYVLITKGINKGEEWFIPARSIHTKESINRLRSMNILKQINNITL